MYYKVNQTKTNLQKHFHPSSLNQLTHAFAYVQCREPKKVSERFQFWRRRQGFASLEVIALWSWYTGHWQYRLQYCICWEDQRRGFKESCIRNPFPLVSIKQIYYKLSGFFFKGGLYTGNKIIHFLWTLLKIHNRLNGYCKKL